MYKPLEFLLKHKYEILLTLFSFIVLYYFKKSFIVNWDGYEYIKDIYFHRRSVLLLGRLGYIYFFIPVWDILRIVFDFSILNFHHVVRLFNILFGSLIVAFLYLIIKKIFKNNLIALGSAFILLFSKDFIRYSVSINTEVMMIFFIILSFYFYVISFEKKNSIYLYFSAFLFGYAFEVREVALFSILFFLAFYFSKKDLKIFNLKNYILFLTIMFFASILGPLIFYFIEGDKYIGSILYHLNVDKTLSISSFNKFIILNKLIKAYDVIREGFGILLFAWLGFIILIFKKRYRELLIIFSLFLPIIILTFYGGQDQRYFIVGYLSLSVLTSISLFYLIRYLCMFSKIKKYKKHIYLIFLLIMLSFNFFNFYDDLINENDYSKHLEKYGLGLLNGYPDNVVFLIGWRSSLMGHYYIPLTGSKKKVIWSGWAWPGRNLNRRVENYLSQNKTIIIDLSHYNGNERRDVESLMSIYKPKKNSRGLYIISNLK
jgi:4-amino-4-deoxy-L-arabinose transferase-like glycosyltransferase